MQALRMLSVLSCPTMRTGTQYCRDPRLPELAIPSGRTLVARLASSVPTGPACSNQHGAMPCSPDRPAPAKTRSTSTEYALLSRNTARGFLASPTLECEGASVHPRTFPEHQPGAEWEPPCDRSPTTNRIVANGASRAISSPTSASWPLCRSHHCAMVDCSLSGIRRQVIARMCDVWTGPG
jgi:hypothetical protein